jgi:hypothetical protein
MQAIGNPMPSAAAVSHRQQAMRIAINTGCLALIRPQPSAGGLVFRISVSKCRLHAAWAGHRRHLDRQSAREGKAVASTFQRGLWRCVD